MNQVIMRMLQEGQSGAGGSITQADMLMEFMKYDDELYVQEGIRREQIDKAIQVYQIKASEFAGAKEEPVSINLGGESPSLSKSQFVLT